MPAMLYCDLHVHSNCSDGMCAPEEIAVLAAEANLAAVALTDHNTAAGLERFYKAARAAGILPVCGCEFSTEYAGKEFHILGLFLPRGSWPSVAACTEDRNRRKTRSNRDCVERLAAAGYAVDYDDILNANPGASVNRVHIARALMEKGYVTSVKDAFDRLLQPEHGFFREPARMDALEIIRSIREWGGAAVWAHPLTSATCEEAEIFLRDAVSAGLDGMETVYSTYTPEETRRALSMAERFGLLPSGGSDFHGANKPDIAIGTGRGNLRVPMEYLHALAERADSRKIHQ